jgi:predicted transcriptional regulator
MQAARIVRYARRRAGLSQRALASAAGVPQSTVARIETGQLAPRTDTLERVLRASGHTLAIEASTGTGIDRSQIRELLRLTPGERARLAVSDAAAAAKLEHPMRR